MQPCDPGSLSRSFQGPRFVVNGPQKITYLAVDFHVNPAEVPFPLAALAHAVDASSVNLSGEDRAETVPPAADGLVAACRAISVHRKRGVCVRIGDD